MSSPNLKKNNDNVRNYDEINWDIQNPQLQWKYIPLETESFLLLLINTDTEKIYWMVNDIDPRVRKI